ncbi:MAG TPA: lipoyl synthase [Thermodesulfovibrionales bacterium]|nr:lipoyl synthase [Thermodesulfovibrionales bacterium]
MKRDQETVTMRLPDWIKTKGFTGRHETRRTLRQYGLSTVCEEARCPNIGICFSKPTAAFMILGSSCTRNCGFCSVESSIALPPDGGEPQRVAMAARDMGLRYVVVTSVTRDDLPDGGSSHFAETVRALRDNLPQALIEVLIPDFKGDGAALGAVLSSGPDVLNHNVETVPRLYPLVRPQADYKRSLTLLRNARAIAPSVPTKSGLMVGLGETFQEVLSVMREIHDTGCHRLTIGQYLRPSKKNLPVAEYVLPEVFDRYRDAALGIGFKGVASSPLVRSSMNAEEMFLAGERF